MIYLHSRVFWYLLYFACKASASSSTLLPPRRPTLVRPWLQALSVNFLILHGGRGGMNLNRTELCTKNRSDLLSFTKPWAFVLLNEFSTEFKLEIKKILENKLKFRLNLWTEKFENFSGANCNTGESSLAWISWSRWPRTIVLPKPSCREKNGKNIVF